MQQNDVIKVGYKINMWVKKILWRNKHVGMSAELEIDGNMGLGCQTRIDA